MQRLSLMRHAEAVEATADTGDHARPLTARGTAAARAMGTILRQDGCLPDLLLCSDARRAVETAHALCTGAGSQVPLLLLPALYGCDPPTVLTLVGQHAAPMNRHVMVIGHNPTVAALAEMLTAPLAPPLGPGGFAPGTCASFTVADDGRGWADLRQAQVRFERLILPEAADAGRR
jgi:phosphohistidine phosphatase